jgi:hypothetical protein
MGLSWHPWEPGVAVVPKLLGEMVRKLEPDSVTVADVNVVGRH